MFKLVTPKQCIYESCTFILINLFSVAMVTSDYCDYSETETCLLTFPILQESREIQYFCHLDCLLRKIAQKVLAIETMIYTYSTICPLSKEYAQRCSELLRPIQNQSELFLGTHICQDSRICQGALSGWLSRGTGYTGLVLICFRLGTTRSCSELLGAGHKSRYSLVRSFRKDSPHTVLYRGSGAIMG